MSFRTLDPRFTRESQWSARLLPEVSEIVGRALGPRFVRQAAINQDMKEGTDLVVLQGADLRVAVRIRRHRYLGRYPDEFTIRSVGRGGAVTELDKIMKGWGDYLFYGFADAEGTGLAKWFVADLNVFRERLLSTLPIPSYREHTNGPNDTQFVSFDTKDFPPDFIVDQYRRAA